MSKKKPKKTRRPNLTEEQKRDILKDRAAGMSHRELAAKYNVARTAIGRVCADDGQRESMALGRAIVHDVALGLRAQGLSYAEIAKRLGETPSKMHRILTETDEIKDGDDERECSGCGDEATRAAPICPSCIPRFDHAPVLHQPMAIQRHTYRLPREVRDQYATARPGGGW